MKNKRAPSLLALILAVPAFAFADNIPGHSKAGNNYVSFSEGLTEEQGSQSNSARCNLQLSSIKENRPETSAFAKGEKGANLGANLSTGVDSNTHPVNLVNFGGNPGASLDQDGQDKDKDKGKGSGKPPVGAGDENGPGGGGGAASPLIAVAEPGSQSLLLFGLAGVGMLFYRRRSLTRAI